MHADGRPSRPASRLRSIALSTGRDVVGELVGLHLDDGELRWISVNARALREGEAISGVVSTFVDVTEQRSTVVALADSERRFRLLAENSSDLITSIDPGGVRTYVSPSCRGLLGYEPEGADRQARDRHPPPRRPGPHRNAPASVLEHGPATAEARFRHKYGGWVWMETRGRAVHDERGDVVEVQAVARDVTERRQAEEVLRASEAAAVAARDALETVLDATTQYAIIGTDADGLITVFNGGAELMLGYRAEDVVGAAPPRAVPRPRGARAASASEFGIPVTRVLGHGTRDKDTDTRDWTLVRRDGFKVPVALTITAIRASDGTLTGYLGIGRDITAERQAARELRDAEERFRNAFDQAPIGKALVSPDGHFTRVNTALCRITATPSRTCSGPRSSRSRTLMTSTPTSSSCTSCSRARARRTRWRSATGTPPATTSGCS